MPLLIAYGPDYSDLNASSPLLQIAQQRESLKRCVEQTTFIESLAPNDSDLVVVNQRVGGFTSELAKILEYRGIRALVFAGVATNISVESSARTASDHGFLWHSWMTRAWQLLPRHMPQALAPLVLQNSPA